MEAKENSTTRESVSIKPDMEIVIILGLKSKKVIANNPAFQSFKYLPKRQATIPAKVIIATGAKCKAWKKLKPKFFKIK